jgi:glucosamine--fructose-6-phosphate aminotransferase (isomerizing)
MSFEADSGNATLNEIYNQANSCRVTIDLAQSRLDLIAPLFSAGPYTDIIITGCGSSHNLAMCASFAWSALLRRPIAAVAASELLHFPEHYLQADAKPLVFAISRSGGTTEVKLAVERLKRQYNAKAIAVTGETGGSVASVCDVELAFAECYEHSVVMTQAFTCMLVGFYLLADGLTGDRHRREIEKIPALIDEALTTSEKPLRKIAEDASLTRFVFLGSGAMKGLADECALKVTEMSLDAAVSYRTLEFRHGPKAALNNGTQVFIFPVAAEVPHLPVLLDEIAATGARSLVITHSAATDAGSFRFDSLGIKNDLAQNFSAALYAHVGQILAYWRAAARQTNPDAPPHLARTVLLNA